MLYGVYDTSDTQALILIRDMGRLDPAYLPLMDDFIRISSRGEDYVLRVTSEYMTDTTEITYTDAVLFLIALEGKYKEVGRVASEALLKVLIRSIRDPSEVIMGSRMMTFDKLIELDMKTLSASYGSYGYYLENPYVIMHLQRRERIPLPLCLTFDELEERVARVKPRPLDLVFDNILASGNLSDILAVCDKRRIDMGCLKPEDLGKCPNYFVFRYILDDIAPRVVPTEHLQDILEATFAIDDPRRFEYLAHKDSGVVRRWLANADSSDVIKVLTVIVTNGSVETFRNVVSHIDEDRLGSYRDGLLIFATRRDDNAMFSIVLNTFRHTDEEIAKAVCHIINKKYVTRILRELKPESLLYALYGMYSVDDDPRNYQYFVGLHNYIRGIYIPNQSAYAIALRYQIQYGNIELIRTFYELSGKKFIPDINMIIRTTSGYTEFNKDVIIWVLATINRLNPNEIMDLVARETNDDWKKVADILDSVPHGTSMIHSMIESANSVINVRVSEYLSGLL